MRILKWIGIITFATAALIAAAVFYFNWQDREIDVAGLECRMGAESNKDGNFSEPENPDQKYFYLLLRARRASPEVVSGIMIFAPDEANPSYLVNSYSGKVESNPDTIRFEYSEIGGSEDTFSMLLHRKKLTLVTSQRRHGDYIVSRLHTSGRWPNLPGDLGELVLEDRPFVKYLAREKYVSLSGCRKVDADSLRTVAGALYLKRLEGNQL